MEGACLAREREESDAILPDRSVQRHSVTSLETARSLGNVPSWGGGGGGGEGEVGILRSPGIAASPISLSSTGGVCGGGAELNGGGKFSSLEGKHASSI